MMSSKNDKIITLPSRSPMPAATTDRLSEPLHSLREQTLRRITELLGELFDKVDDALFDRAENAQNTTLQSESFEGMREVRRKRQRAERLTFERIGQAFIDFSMGRLLAPQGDKAGSLANLSLVEESELEESLAISSMVAKADTRLNRSLFALNRRFSALRGGAAVENNTNPIGPAQLCDAFRIGMAEIDIQLSVRLVVYKLFDRHVVANLEPLYDEINAQLIQAGVLPELRHQVNVSNSGRGVAPRPAPGAAGVASAAADAAEPAADAGADAGQAGPSSIENEIYQTLRSLMALRHAPAGAPGVPAAGAPAVASGEPRAAGPMVPAVASNLAATDLLSALQILQSQTLQAQAQAAAMAVPNAGQLKQALIDEADRMHAGGKAKVASVDEDTIDLVGMLFEFIVQDRNLPSDMQALLGRLQIPFLKIAILDRHLFTQKTHPARQLLDNMAQACIGKADDEEPDPILHDKIRQIVESILRDFDDDMGLIERANAEFSQFLSSTRLRSELAEKRTAETIQGREKLDQARRMAAGEVRKRSDGKALPALVQSLLNGPFAQLLVLIALRQGDDSGEWKQALSFADALVWSAQPKTSGADAIKLNNMLPSMKTYLRQGLAKVAWQEADIDNVIKQLEVYYRHHLETARDSVAAQTFAPLTRAGAAAAGPNAQPPGSTPFESMRRDVEAQLAKEAPAVEALVSMMDKSAIEAPPPAPVVPEIEQIDIDAAYLEQVKAMKVGTWVEFANDTTGMRERAKLSWISPISSKYLFVDRKGLKVADKTVPELAAAFSAGKVTMLDDSMPLFDRALTAVVERLKTFQPKPA